MSLNLKWILWRVQSHRKLSSRVNIATPCWPQPDTIVVYRQDYYIIDIINRANHLKTVSDVGTRGTCSIPILFIRISPYISYVCYVLLRTFLLHRWLKCFYIRIYALLSSIIYITHFHTHAQLQNPRLFACCRVCQNASARDQVWMNLVPPPIYRYAGVVEVGRWGGATLDLVHRRLVCLYSI